MPINMPRAPGLRAIAARMRGVTLIELLIVIVVIGILSSMAVGSYRRYMLRSNRTDGTATLLRVQIAEEKFYVQNSIYTTSFGTDGLNMATGTSVASLASPNGYFTLSIAARTGGFTLSNSYVATATAANGQTQDTQCTSLTMDDTGAKGSSPSAISTCWH